MFRNIVCAIALFGVMYLIHSGLLMAVGYSYWAGISAGLGLFAVSMATAVAIDRSRRDRR